MTGGARLCLGPRMRLRLPDRDLRVCHGLRVCAGLRIRGGLRVCAGLLHACGRGLLLLAAPSACLLSAATSAAAAPEGAGAGAAASGGAATPASAQASATAPVPRLLRVEPPRDSAHHIGDLVTYRALIARPPGWDMARDRLCAPTRESGPIKLRGHGEQARHAQAQQIARRHGAALLVAQDGLALTALARHFLVRGGT